MTCLVFGNRSAANRLANGRGGREKTTATRARKRRYELELFREVESRRNRSIAKDRFWTYGKRRRRSSLMTSRVSSSCLARLLSFVFCFFTGVVWQTFVRQHVRRKPLSRRKALGPKNPRAPESSEASPYLGLSGTTRVTVDNLIPKKKKKKTLFTTKSRLEKTNADFNVY